MRSLCAIALLIGRFTRINCEGHRLPGSNLHGEDTPDVREAWCETRYQGKTVQHGPYRAWWPNGQLGTSGTYVYGKQEGRVHLNKQTQTLTGFGVWSGMDAT